MVTQRPARPSWVRYCPYQFAKLELVWELPIRTQCLDLPTGSTRPCSNMHFNVHTKNKPEPKKITRAALGLLGTFSMSGGGWIGVGGGWKTNDRPETDHVTWGPMRGLKNNGRLLCSPGTSFAPLGLNGAEPHTDGHGNSIKESAQWGQFSEKKTYLDTSQFLLPPPPPPHLPILTSSSPATTQSCYLVYQLFLPWKK